MATPVYEKGTIKVVWVEDNPRTIFSRMFEDEKEAEDFAEGKKDYIIFRLLYQKNMEEFSWEILPYGHHKIYTILVKTFRFLKKLRLF